MQHQESNADFMASVSLCVARESELRDIALDLRISGDGTALNICLTYARLEVLATEGGALRSPHYDSQEAVRGTGEKGKRVTKTSVALCALVRHAVQDAVGAASVCRGYVTVMLS